MESYLGTACGFKPCVVVENHQRLRFREGSHARGSLQTALTQADPGRSMVTVALASGFASQAQSVTLSSQPCMA